MEKKLERPTCCGRPMWNYDRRVCKRDGSWTVRCWCGFAGGCGRVVVLGHVDERRQPCADQRPRLMALDDPRRTATLPAPMNPEYSRDILGWDGWQGWRPATALEGPCRS